MSRGNIPLSVPADLMHSFQSENNSIEWKIKIRGEIPRWPDIGDEFEIKIRPYDPSLL